MYKRNKIIWGLLIFFPFLIYFYLILRGGYYYSGDGIFPLNPEANINKSLYLWEEVESGKSFFKYMYLNWQSFFYVLSRLSFSPAFGIKIFIILTLSIGVIFTYLSYWELFKEKKYLENKIAVICGLFFFLNPISILVLKGAYQLYFLPSCIFFLIKYLDTKNFLYTLPLAFFINFGSFSDLPQAKYLVIYSFSLLFIVLLYSYLRKINFKELIFPLIKVLVITILLNAYLLMPFINDVILSNNNVNKRKILNLYGGNADIHSASLSYVFNFYNSNFVNDVTILGKTLQSPVFLFWCYFLWGLIFWVIYKTKEKKEKKLLYFLTFFLIFFIFWAKGPNPPFGEVYKFLLLNFVLFGFFRTTPIILIGCSFFFSILLGLVFKFIYSKSKKLFYFFLIIHIFVFRFVFLDYSNFEYLNNKNVRKRIDIPQDYFATADILRKEKIDGKILTLPFNDSYSYKDWNFSGSTLMPWVIDKPVIGSAFGSVDQQIKNSQWRNFSKQEICAEIGVQNISYIIEEKDSLDVFDFNDLKLPAKPIYSGENLVVNKVDDECFVPHLYLAKQKILFGGNDNDIAEISRLLRNPELSLTYNNLAEIEPNKIVTKAEFIPEDKQEFQELKYKIKIPKDGKYKILSKDLDKINSLKINDIKFDIENGQKITEGESEIELAINNSPEIISKDWFDNRKGDDYTKLEPPCLDVGNSVMFQSLEGWNKGKTYLLSLEIEAPLNNYIGVLIDERKLIHKGRYIKQNLNFTILNEKISGSGKINYSKIIKADEDAIKAKIYIYNLGSENIVKKVSLKELIIPEIFLETEKDSYYDDEAKLIFRKINPTKYLAEIESLNFPVYLVFSEGFDSRWKVFYTDKKLPDQKQFETIEFPSKKVSQQVQNYKFLSISDILNFNQKTVPENSHFLANGYANGWIIEKSKNCDGKKCKLIIEYVPQRLFIVGITISFISVLIILIISFIKVIKIKNTHRKN